MSAIVKPFIRIACLFWLLLVIPASVISQTFPNSPIPWRDAYNIVLGDFRFHHPMTVINRDDLDTSLARIKSNIEPQASACLKLLSEAKVQLDFIPDAPDAMNIMGGYEPNSNLNEMRDWLWRNCHAAYTSALAYAHTDDTVYALKAREVIMDWANTYTTFTGGDRGLQLGSWFSPLLYAADLIWDYPGFTDGDKTQLRKWVHNKWLDEGDLLNVMRTRDNNWKDAGILGVMCSAVILEDTMLLKEALVQLTSYFFSRVDSYVDLPGVGWKILSNSHGVYLPREVVRNDGSSGLTYTAYALTTMTQCLEIARYSGFDIWHYTTEQNVSIKDVIEQYFEWDVKQAPFYWNSSPSRTSKRRNSYELANTHFELSDEMRIWIRDHRPLSGREGDEYTTLNKGVAIPESLSAEDVPVSLNGYSLDQNTPNPFKRSTLIKFNVPSSEHVRIEVYNVSGQLITILLDEEVEAGSHVLHLETGRLPEGLYLYRITSGGFTGSKRMIIKR